MKDKSTKQSHWNQIFTDKSDDSLGWYESDVSFTLDFFPPGLLMESQTIFFAGAGTSQLVDRLLVMGHHLVLNDISEVALEKLRVRLDNQPNTHWLPADLSNILPEDIPKADIWIDRAVLHFLIDEKMIEQYFANLFRLVKKCGYVLLAEFSETGAERCAGLPVRRYSLKDMNRWMLTEFTLMKHTYYDYVTPAGGIRPYLYALYRKD